MRYTPAIHRLVLALIMAAMVSAASPQRSATQAPAQEGQPQPVDSSKVKALVLEIETFHQHQEQLRRLNSAYNIGFTITALALSAGIIFAGVYNKGRIAAVLGSLVTIVISVQSIFPVADREEYYRVLVAQSENVLDDLNYKTRNTAEFDNDLKLFQALRAHPYPGTSKESLKALLASIAPTASTDNGKR